MIIRTIRTAAPAATVVIATTAGAFAATAWADGKVSVKDEPAKWADTIDHLKNGEKVDVLDCFTKKGTKWCEIEDKWGNGGYVRASDLAFKAYKPKKPKKGKPGVEFCMGDTNFSFCLDSY